MYFIGPNFVMWLLVARKNGKYSHFCGIVMCLVKSWRFYDWGSGEGQILGRKLAASVTETILLKTRGF